MFDEIVDDLCSRLEERQETIKAASRYLKRFVKGISICQTDVKANNGGCTEPHVSHILSRRLSSRPMAWSKKTLAQLAPILASGQLIMKAKETTSELSDPMRKAVMNAKEACRKARLARSSQNQLVDYL